MNITIAMYTDREETDHYIIIYNNITYIEKYSNNNNIYTYTLILYVYYIL